MYSLLLHGKKCIELHKVCNLRAISVKLVQNASPFSNSFSSAASAVTKLAESILTKANPGSVLKLLTSYGFTDSQISGIIRNYPRLLTLDAETFLLPKLQALQSRGASSSEFTEIVSKVPRILSNRMAKSTGLYYDFIRDIIEKDKEEEGDKTSTFDSSANGRQGNKIRNITALRELGVPQRFLFTLLVSKYQPVCGKERFEESVKKVVEMGFDPTTSRFVQALHVVYETSEETRQEKVETFKRLGFSEEDVMGMFNKWPYTLKFSEKKIAQTFETLKECGFVEEEVMLVMKKRPELMRSSEEKVRNCVDMFLGIGFSREEFVAMVKCFPNCVGLSEENVRKKVEFLVKEMEFWSLKDVVSFPPVLGYSLEKRIVPRCNVIKGLVSKGLIKGEKGVPPMASVLASSDKVFVERFVMKHGKLVPKLMAIFSGDRASLRKEHTPTKMKNV
ncbi:unnamed protein product [Microthlaspi erraticum]|uniref:Uncharacterized protein n=1 Tax=Microthlaspi erraticum TaxID=1685480 RepID=A0A6D2HRX3_9BRAS|nr:unnamed protein product [Microthlaspi erraticum]